MSIPQNRISWQQSHRLIPSRFPPIDLFDDIADPADWELLAAAEAKTNPRVFVDIGDIGLVPVNRRVNGVGASWIMGAFTHISTDRPTRFSNGTYGVYYCAKELETAFYETAYHQALFLAATQEDAGWMMQMRQLTATVENDFHDIRGPKSGPWAGLYHPDDYREAQTIASGLRASGANGIAYSSVRHEGGDCLAVFWPDCIALPTQSGHWQYHWNGSIIDKIKRLDNPGSQTLVYEL